MEVDVEFEDEVEDLCAWVGSGCTDNRTVFIVNLSQILDTLKYWIVNSSRISGRFRLNAK